MCMRYYFVFYVCIIVFSSRHGDDQTGNKVLNLIFFTVYIVKKSEIKEHSAQNIKNVISIVDH